MENFLIGQGDVDVAIAQIFMIFVAGVGMIWCLIKINKNNEKRKRTTQLVRAVISEKRPAWDNCPRSPRYIYKFSGLDRYKGITFYDKSAKFRKSYAKGTEVMLYVNPDNVEEFWYEEELVPDMELVYLCAFVIFLALLFG